MSRALALALLVAACGGAPPGEGDAPGGDLGAAAPSRAGVRIVVVSHGQSSDPFWSVVARGAEDAGRDLGVEVEYQAPLQFDMVAMSDRIHAAVASRPAGLVVSIPDPDALGSAIRAAVAAGIPAVSMNSGDEAWEALGLLAHVGQTEHEAGAGAGERMGRAGARRALCVNHEIGNAALDLRCRGFADGLAEAGGESEVLAVDLANPDDAEQRIARALAADPAVDAVLTLGSAGAAPALAALADLPATRRVGFATFDLSPEVLAAVRDGAALFAVDQQPYLQGYLPVVLLVKHRETGVMPGGGQVLRTGPGYVTAADAGRVIALAAQGLR